MDLISLEEIEQIDPRSPEGEARRQTQALLNRGY